MEFYICEKHFQRLCFKDVNPYQYTDFLLKGISKLPQSLSPIATRSSRRNTAISPNSRYSSQYLPVDKRAPNKSLLLPV